MRKRILIITYSIPYPPNSGARLRVFNLLKGIAKQHEVWLAALLATPEETEGVAHLEQFCRKVETVTYQQRHPITHLPGLVRYALAGVPMEFRFFYSEALARKIQRLVSTVNFDIVQIEQSNMALYLEALPADLHCKSLLAFHDVVFQQYGRISRIQSGLGLDRKVRAWLHSRMMRRWEPNYAKRFDRCIAMSETDRRLLMAANPQLQVDVVPNGVDTQLYQPLPQEGTSPALLFIGTMNYPPCKDAVLYFCSEVLPRIRHMIGDVEMWIVGRDPTPEVMQLSRNGVHVTGRVEDVIPYYRRSAVCVVPLRAGSGTRLKILEAMALGRPVVSTTIGSEGLDVVDGEHVLIADTPEQFAEQTARLLTDKSLYERITTNARELVVTHYDWRVITEKLMQIYAEMVE